MTDAEREELISELTTLQRDRSYRRLIERCEELGGSILSGSPEIVVRLADAYIASLRKDEAAKLLETYQGSLAGLTGPTAYSYKLLNAHLDMSRGRIAFAESVYRRLIEDEERGPSTRQIAIAYNALGIIAGMRGLYEIAKSEFARSTAVWQRLGDLRFLGASNHNAGIVARDWGDKSEALAHFRTAADYFGRSGLREEQMSSVGERAMLHMSLSDGKLAEELAAKALSLSKTSSSAMAKAGGQFYWGLFLAFRMDLEGAIRSLETALSLIISTSEAPLRTSIMEELSVVYAAAGDTTQAKQLEMETLVYLRALEAPRRIDRLRNRVRASRRNGRAEPRWNPSQQPG